ncbi:MAG TPA: type III PLP-dependent enzyme [Candidatus Omnitrophota bacterium]|jgi:ornithine decarboxylase|nr:MAG: Lysine/ornithine decarboxylase [Candidatus Omnitrophica bacterium ADurb.Bin314]HOE68324.1 type III PLP-dependent enzyme [Candidatus Omnitrophota bacterium]HPW64742.1 type III PLP-dependent enzyme [Candidatus Omnitrophota bacterium]HQB94941.1 type III PLP-dependent enzyme [Candidatus Omnitrophota bacterium]
MKQPLLESGSISFLNKAVRPTESSGIENLIRQMLKKHKTPFLLIRKSVLEKQFNRFRKALPEVTPYYAIKANPHPRIVKYFAKLGACFDVASAAEMKLVLKQGAKPSHIIFANTIKSKEDIVTARKRRVRLMTFDNEAELYKIAESFPGAHVILRIRVENRGSVVQLSLKFGAEPDQGFCLLRKAKSLGLVPKGVSFHVGSQSTNVENYLQALELTAGIFREAKENGMPLSIVDIGGGFPIPHFENEIGINFERMAAQIRKQMKELFPKSTHFIAEPGRFFAGPSGVLVTQVVGKAFRDNKNFYYINDGIYQDFSGMMFDHCKYEFKTLRRGQKTMSVIAGPTCDSLDILTSNEEFPELFVGDVVYVKNIGAYSCASAVPNFNGFEPAKVILV